MKSPMVLSTDEMDSTTPEQRYALIGKCEVCGEMVKFTYKPKNNQIADYPRCECGGKLINKSVQSQRTYVPPVKKQRRY